MVSASFVFSIVVIFLLRDSDWQQNSSEAVCALQRSLVVPVGLEPTTLALSTRCSNQLSYGTVSRKWFGSKGPPSLIASYGGQPSLLI